ncbi:hypothetical protein [Sphingomonas montana]|uniref:hypothetical protein n=1 Tax=Sphingomonas montana TaxID=1843236 RepID=UPI0013EA90D7|nr:hypothetical protein [Sphingomonas montana]
MTSEKDKARARQAKGSVQEAIGKIIGDTAVEKRGSRERKAGARQSDTKHPTPKDGDD